MTYAKIVLLCAALFALSIGHTQVAEAAPPQTVALWPAGSPTLQGANEKEITKPSDPKPGQWIDTIKNVHTPTLEVHLAPADKANGTAIIIAPGGGHEFLVWGGEGTKVADWLNGLGISAFILKYRLAQTPGYHYTVEGEALQDTQRAFRIIRAHATEWNVSPDRIGILGFSAGGALAALADVRFDRGDSSATDPIARQSCRPDFAGLVYPGWQPMNITAPKDAAPAFVTCAGSDDQFHAKDSVDFYNSLFQANIPVELHIYAHGGHGGSIGTRKGIPFGTWPARFQEWLADKGLLTKAP